MNLPNFILPPEPEYAAPSLPASSPLINNSIASLSALDILQQNFNPALNGPGWTAFLSALAVGDQINIDNAAAIKQQLFLSTASGIYLQQRASDIGISIPFELGISDEVFRDLAITYTYNKVTRQALSRILEIFYGSNATRASALSGASDQSGYNINPGDTLTFTLNGQNNINIIFMQGDFITNGNVKAIEVATAINHGLSALGFDSLASNDTDNLGNSYVRLYSDALGLAGSIQVTGGTAQNILQFPSIINTTNDDTTQWNISNSASAPGNIRYTYTGTGTNPNIQLLQIGYYVTIIKKNADSFNIINTGSFPIVAVTTTWFEVFNPSGINQTNVSISDMLFFNPTINTINNIQTLGNNGNAVSAYVLDTNPDDLIIYLPATSILVSRGPLLAAYLQTTTNLSISQVNRTITGLTTITTTTNHNLSIGQQILIDGINTNPKSNNTMVAAQNMISTRFGHTATLLNNGKVLVVGGAQSTSSFNSLFVLTFPIMWGAGLTAITNCELYDPVHNTWTATGSLNTGRSFHLAFLLDNGNVMVCGGENPSGSVTNTSEIYNVSSGTWSYTSNNSSQTTMNSARTDFSGIILGKDRRILVTGGLSTLGGSALNSTEFFDQSTQIWTTGPNLNLGRFDHATVYSSLTNSALVLGGATGTGTTDTNTIEQNTLSANGGSWSTLNVTLTTNRYGFAYTLLNNGFLLISGGLNSMASFSLNSAELYPISSPNLNVVNITSAPYSAGNYNFIDISGQSGIDYTNSVLLSDGNVLLTPAYFNSDGLFNSIQNALLPTINYPAANYSIYNTATLLNNGQVLLAGGLNPVTDISTAASYIYSETVASGHFNGAFTVQSTPTSTTFTVNTNYPYITQIGNGSSVIGQIIVYKQQISVNGPYIWSTESTVSPSLTSISTTLTQVIDADENYTTINVNNASAFKANAPGYLVFNFGSDEAVYPVKFIDAPTPTTLLIDGTFTFPYNIPNGSDVTLLDSSKINFVPKLPQSVGSFYITGANEGRVQAQKFIDNATAGGVPHLDIIKYPNDYGLGNWGHPTYGSNKLSDIVEVYGNDNLDEELIDLREE